MSDSGREWPSELSDAEYLRRFGRPREDKPAEPTEEECPVCGPGRVKIPGLHSACRPAEPLSELGGDLATDLDYQGPMPHVDALSNSKLGRVNYLNDRSYPDHTATCTVCGAIAKPGGKCESCGSDKLSELRGAGEAAKPEQLISRKLVLIAISELSTQSDGSSEWQAFQNGLAASIMAVLAIQPSPSPDSAAPELPRGVEDVLLRPDSGSLPSLDIRPEDRGPDVTYIGMERVLLERQNCRERQLREALRELASLRERLGVR